MFYLDKPFLLLAPETFGPDGLLDVIFVTVDSDSESGYPLHINLAKKIDTLLFFRFIVPEMNRKLKICSFNIL